MDENKTYGTRLARLWKLFLSTLYISSFTFGGGFVIVTFMKKKFVDELHWIDEQEMLDMTALAQSSPGAIAVNAAILVGWQVEGLIGMIVAVLGTIIPPMVILSVISVFYNAFATNRYIALLLKGMQAGVMQPSVAMMAPGTCAIRKPTKVAELTAMGPGVISAIVMRSVNSCIVSQPCCSTTWLWISGMAA